MRSLPRLWFVARRAGCARGRKVRTPQGSVPDNVRDVSVKAHGRPVPQKRNRLGDSLLCLRAWSDHPLGASSRRAGVRVKRCGKSAPLRL